MKTPMDVLSQLERIEYRYRRYNTLYAHQIWEILNTFKKNGDTELMREYMVGEDEILNEKIDRISQKKLEKALHALQDFNTSHGTNRGPIEYLYASISRSSTAKHIQLIHPKSFPNIHKNIGLLKEVGFSDEELWKYLIHSMQSLKNTFLRYRPQRNREHLDLLRDDLGFSNEEIQSFLYHIPNFFYPSSERYREKIHHFHTWGIPKESLREIIGRFPYCLNYSKDKISNTFKKIKEINNDSRTLLVQHPYLFYFNPETDFFRRLVVGLTKGHKRYQNIISRIQERFTHTKIFQPYIKQPLSEEEYLKGLQTEEYKRHFLFNPEESSKSYPKYKEHAFTESKKYISDQEYDFIRSLHEQYQEGNDILEHDVKNFQEIMEKIEKKDTQLYNDFVIIFTYKESYKSRLRQEDDDMPF